MDNYENNQNNQGYTPDNNEQPQQTYQAQPQQYNTQQQYNAQQPYQAQPQQYNAQPAPKQNDSKAIASLILGIVSIICCNPLFAASIVGIIMGVQSRKANPENNTMATVGIILSAVGIFVWLIGTIISVVAIVSGNAARSYPYTYY